MVMKLISIFILLIIIIAIIAWIRSKKLNSSSASTIQIKHGFFHHNGNLDFYLSTDGSFISRTANRSFNLADIEILEAYADGHLVFEKTKEHTSYDNKKIDELFQNSIKHITYQLHLTNGEHFESVVDVATNQRSKQKLELKTSLHKLISLLKEAELTV